MNTLFAKRWLCFVICLFFGMPGEASKDLLTPRIELRQVGLTSLGLGGADFAIELAVANPNRVAITVENVDYTLHVGETPIKNGMIRQVERFGPQSTRNVSIPVRVSYGENLGAVLAALNQRSTSHYRVEGSIKLRGIDERFPFVHRGLVPLGGR